MFEKFEPIPDDELSTWVHEGNWEALFRVADLWADEAGITRLGKTVMSDYEKSRYYYICDIMGKYKGEE